MSNFIIIENENTPTLKKNQEKNSVSHGFCSPYQGEYQQVQYFLFFINKFNLKKEGNHFYQYAERICLKIG